ncbi:MAG TPA: response regulator [Candidatus Baltobacteraceae bacterium]|jgi:DNA-binding NarL/FixJ family response regulator|nr:response regulator [Candidatus Baltobacteraceae bacterium]
MRDSAYVIEPQLLFIPYLTRILERLGIEVIGTSGIVDRQALLEHRPSLIIVDVDYARRRELRLIREIRVLVPHASIIAYSVQSDELFVASCHVAGATCVLSKSEDEFTLCEQIRLAVAHEDRPEHSVPIETQTGTEAPLI